MAEGKPRRPSTATALGALRQTEAAIAVVVATVIAPRGPTPAVGAAGPGQVHHRLLLHHLHLHLVAPHQTAPILIQTTLQRNVRRKEEITWPLVGGRRMRGEEMSEGKARGTMKDTLIDPDVTGIGKEGEFPLEEVQAEIIGHQDPDYRDKVTHAITETI